MNEQQIEALEQLCPDGCVIVIRDPDGTLSQMKYNPREDYSLELIHAIVKEVVWTIEED